MTKWEVGGGGGEEKERGESRGGRKHECNILSRLLGVSEGHSSDQEKFV